MSFRAIKEVDIAGSTLVIPSISIGNLPQLTIDLLIHSLPFERIGYLDCQYLYPFISPQDHKLGDDLPGISQALEVYYSLQHKITVIQQRAPIISNFLLNYLQEIINPFIVKGQFSNIYLLDSNDAGLLNNYDVLQKIDVLKSEEILSKSLANLNLSISQENLIKFSKFTTELCKNSEVQVLVSYIYEGDNFYDAEVQGRELLKILKIDNVNWTRPVSWLGVYGDKEVSNAMEDGLYG